MQEEENSGRMQRRIGSWEKVLWQTGRGAAAAKYSKVALSRRRPPFPERETNGEIDLRRINWQPQDVHGRYA